MITSLETTELAKIGKRYPASLLVPQAGYLLALAVGEGERLTERLPPNLIAEVTALRDEVDKGRQDHAIVEVESKLSTDVQHERKQDLKIWRTQVSDRTHGALRAGAKVPLELTRIGKLVKVSAVLDDASRALGLLTEHAAEFNRIGPNIRGLIDEGQSLYKALDQAGTNREQTRTTTVPAAGEAFNAKKGMLYTGLKIIIHAGHELYARDHKKAASYNLSILNGRGNQSTTEPIPPEPIPVEPPKALPPTGA